MRDAAQSKRFIQTPISIQIAEMINWGVERKLPVLITGEAGIGKTTTVERIAENDDKARLLVASTATGRLKPLLSAIASLFGIWVQRETGYEIERALWHDLPQCKREYLIIDEAQFLDFDALRTVLFLNDQAQLPIVFVGNANVLKRTRGQTAAFNQINDRIGRRIHIGGVSEPNIVAFGIEYNVEGTDAYALLSRLGLKTSLRQLARLLENAQMIAEGAAIKLHHLEDAITYLMGAEGTRFLTAKASAA